jgi:outer membrane protein assembly factor BamD
MADDYRRMGDRFENQEADAYTKIVKDYPLSAHADAAKDRLQAMNRQVPEADPAALARMKYELENRTKAGIPGRVLGVFSSRPDVRAASKSGTPTMAGLRPGIPVSVPQTAAAPGGVTDVNAAVVSNTSVLDNSPDARANPPGQNAPASQAAAGTETGVTGQAVSTQNQPLPSNHTIPQKKQKKQKKNAKQPQTATPDQPSAAPAPASPPQ